MPGLSFDQLGGTLGGCFGVSDTELVNVMPNLANYSTRNLGLLG